MYRVCCIFKHFLIWENIQYASVIWKHMHRWHITQYILLFHMNMLVARLIEEMKRHALIASIVRELFILKISAFINHARWSVLNVRRELMSIRFLVANDIFNNMELLRTRFCDLSRWKSYKINEGTREGEYKIPQSDVSSTRTRCRDCIEWGVYQYRLREPGFKNLTRNKRVLNKQKH